MRILKSVIPLVLLVLVTAQHAEDGNASKQLQHDTKQQPPPKLLPNEQVNSDKKVEKTVLQEKNHNVTSKVAGSNNNKTSNSSLSITHTTHSPIQHYPRDSTLNTGAILRGSFVFLGLSVLAMAYMLFRSLRLNKARTQMVRKYGVLAHRQDVEMRPLPLDEDDEEETTVFAK